MELHRKGKKMTTNSEGTINTATPILELTSKDGTFAELIRKYGCERMGRDPQYCRAVHAKKREKRAQRRKDTNPGL